MTYELVKAVNENGKDADYFTLLSANEPQIKVKAKIPAGAPDILPRSKMSGLLDLVRMPAVQLRMRRVVLHRISVGRFASFIIASTEYHIIDDPPIPVSLIILPPAPPLISPVKAHNFFDAPYGRSIVPEILPCRLKHLLKAVVLPLGLSLHGEGLYMELLPGSKSYKCIVPWGKLPFVSIRKGRFRDRPVNEMPERAVRKEFH